VSEVAFGVQFRKDFSRAEKILIRAYVLKHEPVTKVRIMACGDTKAFSQDEGWYCVTPTAHLLELARAETERKA
jgi:hypothetical protein